MLIRGGSKSLILSMGLSLKKDPSFGALRFRTRTRAVATEGHSMSTFR